MNTSGLAPFEGIAFSDEAAARAQFQIGKTNFRSRIQRGLLPPPVKCGARSIWPRHELDSVARAIIADQTDDEIRALVAGMVAARRMTAPSAASRQDVAA